VTVALDVEPESARPWVEAASPTHTALIDRNHVVDELLGIVNVPSSVWVDEEGMLVRPAEPANVLPSLLDRLDLDLEALPPERREALAEARKIRFEPEKYVAALRDWVEHGSASRYALSPAEVIARSRPRSLDLAAAAAHFELGEYLREQGEVEAAQQHWREAHRLQPENWTYKRQAWELIDSVDGGMQYNVKHVYESNWLEDIRRFGPENYYPALDM
jgi:tetratricopeptide (TPR) repeat protein